MSKNNLQELNDMLFDTLRGIKDDEIKPDKAKAIVNVSNSIVGNAKAQLEAFKITGGRSEAPKLFGASVENRLKLEVGSTYDQMASFAKDQGYNNVNEAISKLGKSGFNVAFENYKKGNE